MPEVELPTTQRAYTLRLRGPDKNDNAWREALWATHEAVNKGARVFGDWLLTLRGGLDHKLADEGKPEDRANRRILLALSWLSVEDAHGAGGSHAVADGKQDTQLRIAAVLKAFEDILKSRDLAPADIESWLIDCTPSLSSNIREDAVWVNRSAAFDAIAAANRPTRNEVWDILEPFFGSRNAYFESVSISDDDEDGQAGEEEKAKDLVQKSGQWLSSRFGTGKGADFTKLAAAYDRMKDWAGSAAPLASGTEALKNLGDTLSLADADSDAILSLISGPGYKSATRNLVKKWGETKGGISADDLKKFAETAEADADESRAKTGGKGRRAYSDAVLRQVESVCGFTYLQADGPARHSEFAVMLDHAARRVSMAHSWIKRAEAQRRSFAGNAAKLESVPTPVSKRLDTCVAERSESSNAIEPYRIRPRAIEGWPEIVSRWAALEGKSEAALRDLAKDIDAVGADGQTRTLAQRARIAQARAFQAETEDKFGDIQLFEALAGDDARVVWLADGKADAAPLKAYVQGHDAKHKQTRFKVPAYRHPDALRHPVFVDFGNSRWDIEYAVHKSASASKRRPSQDEAAWLSNIHNLRMGLWNGATVEDTELRWASKRLATDLALPRESPSAPVGRADRLGRAAALQDGAAAASPKALFELADWNGRLQAPRNQLDAVARLEALGKTAKARKLRERLKWLVTFSAKVECRGPWFEYAKQFTDTDPAKPFVTRIGEFAIKHEGQDKRGGHAKLMLSRLPGLRVLSVDLGHRFAAACAVWQVVSAAEFAEAAKAGSVLAGGMGEDALYCHVESSENGKSRKVIYRRIGADTVNGKAHPGPWARLERQFLIKLQGEEEPPRAASKGASGGPDEIKLVEDLANALRRNSAADDEDGKTRNVAELMRRALGDAMLGLKRHGRVAKIAYALNPACPGIPGMGGKTQAITTGDARHIEFITRTLLDWHGLAGDWKWDGKAYRDLWNTYIKPLAADLAIGEPKKPDDEQQSTKQQRRNADEELGKKLEPVARRIAANVGNLATKLRGLWTDLWFTAHGKPADVSQTIKATGWYAHLRLLTDWIMGRKLPGAKDTNWRRHVGGLSLTRIATMRGLYRLHKAFAMHPTPDKMQGAPDRFESNTGIAQSILDAMERMREQRVKQTASRIVEAALSVGCHTGQGKRPVARIDEPCHAVVIENLRNYRPDELQTRRENKALMTWASAKVRRYLEEGCQLHGLHLREVSPNYTSRQCSRTGLPGARCADVTVHDFLNTPWMKKALKRAADKNDAESKLLLALAEHWKAATGNDLKKTVRIPRKGGDLFVSAGGDVVQADLNAAANIGLRALLDPDWAGRWWYVACNAKDGTPNDKLKGSACFEDLSRALKGMEPKAEAPPHKESPKKGTRGGARKEKKGNEIVNAWRDVTTMPPGEASWRVHEAYWGHAKQRVADKLRQFNGLQS